MENDLNNLLEKYSEKVTAVLNILVECSYFYMDDDEDLFYFMRRYKHEFSEFYRKYYDWEFIIDSKCARVYKSKWYNNSVRPEQRVQFRVSGRDEAIAFMCLLEFFEHQLDDNSITAEEKHNLRFMFGDLLQYCYKRFAELFEDKKELYSEENLRSKILRPLMPKLLQYRFLKEIRPEQSLSGLNRYNNDFIYEALPALYHYNTGRLSREVVADSALVENDNESGIDEIIEIDSKIEIEKLETDVLNRPQENFVSYKEEDNDKDCDQEQKDVSNDK
jgi:hypothetical protein